jgi:hypothetical protein
MPFFILMRALKAVRAPRRIGFSVLPAGLLASGSVYSPFLPVSLNGTVAFSWLSSPVTAAGPRWNFTIFPIKTLRVAWLKKRVSELPRCVKAGALK